MSFAATGLTLSAQITVNKNDLIKVGQTVIQSYDNGTYKLPTSGANQTWNLNFLTEESKDTITFGLASWYPGSSAYAGATHGIEEGDSSWTFIKLSDTELSLLGNYSIYNGVADTGTFGFKLLELPATYNKTYKDSTLTNLDPYEFGIDPDGAGPLPTIDSVQLGYMQLSTGKIDAWGKMTTSLGTYDALRNNVAQITSVKMKLKVGPVWINAPQAAVDLILGGSSSDTSNQHFYFTNNASIGFPIVTYDVNATGDSMTGVSWLSSSPKFSNVSNPYTSASISYSNPFGTELKVVVGENPRVLTLVGSNGRVVATNAGKNEIVINTAHLAPGTYFLRVTDARGNAETKTVVKY